MNLQLENKVALVTGGSHGIGQAICVALAEEGCEIYFCSRGVRYDPYVTFQMVQSNGVRCYNKEINASTEATVNEVVKDVFDCCGGVDILVNNIGGGSSWGNTENWDETPSNKWEEVMQHNYMTSVWFTNAVVPHMVMSGWGRVISIAAVYGKERGGMPWFHAAKSAQIALMKSYSGNSKYVTNGITFNTICPGFTDVRHKDKVFGEEELEKVPLRRFGYPEDVAPLVAFLCSDKASYINGACITVDGGMSRSI